MLDKKSLFALSSGVLIASCVGFDDAQPSDPEELAETSAELLATTNRVSPSVATICINGASITGAFSAALNSAIVNYNTLPLTFNFVRTTGSTSGCNAVITAMIQPGFAVTSGFPSASGLPFNQLGVGSGFSVHNADVLEHIFTHLLGHNIGLQHTDTTSSGTPVSCGPGQAVIPNFGGGSGGGGGVGGIMTPGSPPPSPGGSIMNSCIPVGTTGEFTSSDITGLNFLY